MKKFKRFELLITPFLIAMLSIMLIVVSFAWYQVSNNQINIKNNSITVQVSSPKGTNVELELIGDNYNSQYENYYYDYNSSSYLIKKSNSINGYFGQTGLGNLQTNDNDKPYIVFYKAIITNNDQGINIDHCYINHIKIVKNQNYLIDVDLSKSNNDFTIEFYTCNIENDIYSFSNPTNNFINSNNQSPLFDIEVYLGIKFFNGSDPFLYSDIIYYESTFELSVKFE